MLRNVELSILLCVFSAGVIWVGVVMPCSAYVGKQRHHGSSLLMVPRSWGYKRPAVSTGTSTELSMSGSAFSRQASWFDLPPHDPEHDRIHHYRHQDAVSRAAAAAGISSSSSSSSASTISSSNALLRRHRPMSAARRKRLREEQQRSTRFVTGDALHELRAHIMDLRHELDWARTQQQQAQGQLASSSSSFDLLSFHPTEWDDRIQELERSIVQAQHVDAEYVYQVSLDRMEAAQQAGLITDAERYRKEAIFARKALPQFNLEGLWVGKYGEHGFEMINVTYSEDVLIAYKVTGDKRVPKGEISFTVDLSPKARAVTIDSDEERNALLEPIELNKEAAKQWGSRYLQRHSGQGQVASPGYVNKQWVEGQLILVNQYFSFAWLPIGHQVFFGRPSAELTLKLLRESKSKKFADLETREHLNRCWEETESIQDEMEISEDTLFKSHDQTWYYDQQGFFE